jgi:hypothetical protein
MKRIFTYNESFRWPGLPNDAEDHISKCFECSNNNLKRYFTKSRRKSWTYKESWNDNDYQERSPDIQQIVFKQYHGKNILAVHWPTNVMLVWWLKTSVGALVKTNICTFIMKSWMHWQKHSGHAPDKNLPVQWSKILLALHW